MAMARARTAIGICCNSIRQISARRFVAGAGQTTSGAISSGRAGRFIHALPSYSLLSTVVDIAFWGYLVWNIRETKQMRTEANEIMKRLEGKGVTRESCEAKINQKIESGSALQDDRIEHRRDGCGFWMEPYEKIRMLLGGSSG